MEIGTMRGLSGILRNNFALVLIFLHSFGCSGCRSGWDTKDYRSAVRSGRSVIAPAIEMEKQFSNTEHMLIMYGGTGSNKHEWQTVSFFGGRYVLTLSVNVILSSDGSKIVKADEEPKFILWVCQEIHEGGGASYDSSRGQEFGLQKWNEFRDSGFDLKNLDPAYDGSTLPDFDAYADSWQQNRKVWR